MPSAGEFATGGAGEKHFSFFGGPLNVERAALEFDSGAAFGAAGEHAGDHTRTRTTATGLGLTDAALEGALQESCARKDLHELDIGALGKTWIMFDERPELVHVNRIHVRHEDDAMRISQTESCDAMRCSRGDECLVNHAPCGAGHGDQASLQPRQTHAHAHTRAFAVVIEHFACAHLAPGLDPKGAPLCALGDQHRGTAKRVAASRGLGTIRVHEHHASIGILTFEEQHEPIGAYAAVAITDGTGKCRSSFEQARALAHADEVVAAAFDLHEVHAAII